MELPPVSLVDLLDHHYSLPHIYMSAFTEGCSVVVLYIHIYMHMCMYDKKASITIVSLSHSLHRALWLDLQVASLL